MINGADLANLKSAERYCFKAYMFQTGEQMSLNHVCYHLIEYKT